MLLAFTSRSFQTGLGNCRTFEYFLKIQKGLSPVQLFSEIKFSGGGAHSDSLFLRNCWINPSEILHGYLLDIYEELLLGSVPKYQENIRKICQFFWHFANSVNLLMDINEFNSI